MNLRSKNQRISLGIIIGFTIFPTFGLFRHVMCPHQSLPVGRSWVKVTTPREKTFVTLFEGTTRYNYQPELYNPSTTAGTLGWRSYLETRAKKHIHILLTHEDLQPVLFISFNFKSRNIISQFELHILSCENLHGRIAYLLSVSRIVNVSSRIMKVTFENQRLFL